MKVYQHRVLVNAFVFNLGADEMEGSPMHARCDTETEQHILNEWERVRVGYKHAKKGLVMLETKDVKFTFSPYYTHTENANIVAQFQSE